MERHHAIVLLGTFMDIPRVRDDAERTLKDTVDYKSSGQSLGL